MTQSLQQALEQKRAKQAWDDIQSIMDRSKDFKKEYRSLSLKVPMLVLTNGLGQTLAFLRAKGKSNPNDEHNVLFNHLSKWTMSQVAPGAGNQNLLEWVLSNDSTAYRRATAEALAYLVWLKRFAEAELPPPEGG